MKKKLLILLAMVFAFFGVTLSSCSDYGDYVGFWIVASNYTVDDSIKYSSLSDLEKAKEKYGVEYYVDAYSSDSIISHLNNEVPFYHIIEYSLSPVVYYRVVDVYYKGDSYQLSPDDIVVPSVSEISPYYTYYIKRTIKKNGKSVNATVKIICERPAPKE